MASQLLWQPSTEAIAASQMTQFLEFVNREYQQNCRDYWALHVWSVANPALFWQAIWTFMDIIATEPAKQVVASGPRMQDTQWFLGAKLNFAENLLRFRDNKPAL